MTYRKKILVVFLTLSIVATSSSACQDGVGETYLSSPVATASPTKKHAQPLPTSTTKPPPSPTEEITTPTIVRTPTFTSTAASSEYDGVLPSPVPGNNAEQECIRTRFAPAPDIEELAGLLGICDAQGCAWIAGENGIEPIPFSPTSLNTFSNPIVSPTNQWLAYQEVEIGEEVVLTNKLWLVSLTDGQTFTYDWHGTWDRLDTWLNEAQIAILPTNVHNAKIILNPFNGEEYVVSISELDVFPENSILSSEISINSDLSKLVYLHDYDENGVLGYGIWDLSTEEILWKASAYDQVIAGLSNPVWSPRGDLLAVSLGDASGRADIYLIDKDGIEERITSLEDGYPNTLFAIGNLLWSPDGNQLAFWIGTESETSSQFIWHLMVTDINSRQTIDYCINSYGFRPFPSIRWGPGSDRLIAQIVQNDEIFSSQAVILLLKEQLKISTEIENYLFGWMSIKSP